MTRSEMKAYLEGIWEKWHNDPYFHWKGVFEEGILVECEFDVVYEKCPSISGDSGPFVEYCLRKLYPTKLEKALR